MLLDWPLHEYEINKFFAVKNLSQRSLHISSRNIHAIFTKGRGGQEVRGRSCNVTMATPDTRDPDLIVAACVKDERTTQFFRKWSLTCYPSLNCRWRKFAKKVFTLHPLYSLEFNCSDIIGLPRFYIFFNP